MTHHILFFRGAGDWKFNYATSLEPAYQQKELEANPSNYSREELCAHYTTVNTIWDESSGLKFAVWKWTIGWFFQRRQERQWLKWVEAEAERVGKEGAAKSKGVREGSLKVFREGAKDVFSVLFKQGVMFDYAKAILELADIWAERLADNPNDTLTVVGHSLGTAGAWLFVEYLARAKVSPANWFDWGLEDRINLQLFSPAVGFAVVRNKLERYLPRSEKVEESRYINRTSVIIGAEDFMWKSGFFYEANPQTWRTKPPSRAFEYGVVPGVGHDFVKLLQLAPVTVRGLY